MNINELIQNIYNKIKIDKLNLISSNERRKSLHYRVLKVLEEARNKKNFKKIKSDEAFLIAANNSKYIYNGIIITKTGEFFIFNFSNKDAETKFIGHTPSWVANTYLVKGKIDKNNEINIEGITNIIINSNVAEKLDLNYALNTFTNVFDNNLSYKYTIEHQGKDLDSLYAHIKATRASKTKQEYIRNFVEIYKNEKLNENKNVINLFKGEGFDKYMIYDKNKTRFGFLGVDNRRNYYHFYNVNFSIFEYLKHTLSVIDVKNPQFISAIAFIASNKKEKKFVSSEFERYGLRC